MSDDGVRGLRLTNTMTRTKETLRPIDWRPESGVPEAERQVRLYVCGPTVYDFAHIGNARPVIVFDVLFRLLRHLYGADHVTYARNITDVDDKINARAARDFPDLPLNEAIRRVTEGTAAQFHRDVSALGALPPSFEPRATDFVAPRGDGKPDMISMIERLIARGHAYVAAGEVLFDVTSMADYGRLSNRRLDEQQAGARIAVDAHKRNPGDFVLWKLSDAEEPGWDSPWGRGRPGWHIECSVMSEAYLGETFDIHGGGLDLIFPHHENEIAQSRCAHGTETMAEIWMHNGFLQVEGKKMSKSDGNFVTIDELLSTTKFGGRPWPGEVLRLAMLMTHYREPIDFSVRRLEEAAAKSAAWAALVGDLALHSFELVPSSEIVAALSDDLDFASVMFELNKLEGEIRSGHKPAETLAANLYFLGIGPWQSVIASEVSPTSHEIDGEAARMAEVEGGSDGVPYVPVSKPTLKELAAAKLLGLDTTAIRETVMARKNLMAAKNFAEADRLRDELLAQGIQLKDGKDPATGERVTTWEIKR
ncbi:MULTISPECIES: cysteine--tRNA ligase [unclassified Aureimonas]|uniref:cysteine--tRNA ligase n=1 Tax=unclassified Aureimonas TaxID=2615206 RepID=UPI0006F4D644|nr:MULTISPECIES: cysteine--tRNA ligase [unclassified Aureimonas]KQT55327.1 cysteine--tRNA ligase [Aureimonas sp. Leaf427]KQT71118.1 cysteine--tRNA ligase [Aureimonas sp. Leaf460]